VTPPSLLSLLSFSFVFFLSGLCALCVSALSSRSAVFLIAGSGIEPLLQAYETRQGASPCHPLC